MPGFVGQGDVDRVARITGVRCKGRDGWRADATGIAGDGEQIPDGIVPIRRDIPLPVDHLRQAAQVVIDVVGLVGDGRSRYEHTEQQQADHNRKDFSKRHLLHPWFRLS